MNHWAYLKIQSIFHLNYIGWIKGWLISFIILNNWDLRETNVRLWCPRVINHRTVTEHLADKMKKKKDSMWEKVLILAGDRVKVLYWKQFRLVKVHCLQRIKVAWTEFLFHHSLRERPISFLTSIYVNELSWVGPRLIPSGNVCKCYLGRLPNTAIYVLWVIES